MKISWIPSLLLFCRLASPVLAIANSTDESQLVQQERNLQFQERDLCRCQASWELSGGGQSIYYDYSTSFIHSNGYRVVEGIFVIDSTDPICRTWLQATQVQARERYEPNNIFGNRQLTEVVGNESVAAAVPTTVQAENESNVDEEEVQRDLQRYHYSDSGRAPRTRNYRGGPRRYGTGTFQGKGRPYPTQIGKGSNPIINSPCRNDGPGGISSCCFSGCRGSRSGLNQPSGTQCQTCECNCPPIPAVFECPFSPPIIQSVPCDISATVACFRPPGIQGNNIRRPCGSVTQVPFLQCACPGSCASTFEFKYTAKSCRSPATANIRNCRDFGGVFPNTVGIIGSVDGREFYYNPNVSKGAVITLKDGRCIPNELTLTVVDRNNPDRVLQTLDVFTACDFRGVSLADRFGAFEFTAYSCDDGTRRGCLRRMSFEVCARNRSPTAQVSLNAFELDFNNGVTDLTVRGASTSGVGTLGANQNNCVVETRQVSICKRQDFTATAYVEGREGSGPRCADEATTRFTVDVPGLPPPKPLHHPRPRRRPPVILVAGKGVGAATGKGTRGRGRGYGRGGGIYQAKGGAQGRGYGRAYQGKGI